MTEEDEAGFKNRNICGFCEKRITSNKIKDHCNSTRKNRVPVHQKCKIWVTQKQSNFIPLSIQVFRNYDCCLFFEKIIDKEKDKVLFLRQTRNLCL